MPTSEWPCTQYLQPSPRRVWGGLRQRQRRGASGRLHYEYIDGDSDDDADDEDDKDEEGAEEEEEEEDDSNDDDDDDEDED